MHLMVRTMGRQKSQHREANRYSARTAASRRSNLTTAAERPSAHAQQAARGGYSGSAHRSAGKLECLAVGRIDDYAASREVTAHFIKLGHRRIGFILGHPGHGATEQRYLGFVDEMRAHQIPVVSELVQTGNFVFADGLICAERMLRAAAPPTAIFASNDDMAAAVISMARKVGLDLPSQLSVAGFDDAPLATMIWPGTDHRAPAGGRYMARRAADLIIQLEPRRKVGRNACRGTCSITN